MLEAKAKDTGASVLQKKRLLQKNFQAISKKKLFFRRSPEKEKKGLQKNFQGIS